MKWGECKLLALQKLDPAARSLSPTPKIILMLWWEWQTEDFRTLLPQAST